MEKKVGLWPCIGYWGLNQITVKYPDPSPLVPLTISISSLICANEYNQGLIHQGVDQKTASATASCPTGAKRHAGKIHHRLYR